MTFFDDLTGDWKQNGQVTMQISFHVAKHLTPSIYFDFLALKEFHSLKAVGYSRDDKMNVVGLFFLSPPNFRYKLWPSKIKRFYFN